MNLKLFTTPTSRVDVMLQRYEAQIKHHFIMNNCLFIIVIAFNYNKYNNSNNNNNNNNNKSKSII